MVDWKHGYFAESGYTYGFYEETTPARLAWVATLKGHRASLENFRYLDLGCGQGLGLIQLAAIYPKAEFVGVDFMPEHVAHGRALARDAGLDNVQFLEGDFLELAQQPGPLGEFDFVVAHGIATWVSESVREAMFTFAQAVLKPGALMYNSYNTYPGWLHAATFQNLVLQFQKRNNGKEALMAAKALFTKMGESGSAIMTNLPSLQARLEGMDKLDLAYLVQEYNNQYWQPVFSNQMLEHAHRHKLEFLGSATLAELFDGSYPAALRELINQQSDPITREAVRDAAVFQSFRRDVYVKGSCKLWAAMQSSRIKAQRFVATEVRALPPEGEQFSWSFGTMKIAGDRQSYIKVIEAFGQTGKGLGEVMGLLKQNDLSTLVQQVSLLLQGGWLALEGPTGTAAAHQLNRAIAQAVVQGAPYRHLCTPKLQSALGITDLDLMLIALAQKGDSPSELANKLVQAMSRLGKSFALDGQAITDPTQTLTRASETVTGFLTDRLKRYQRFGALPTL